MKKKLIEPFRKDWQHYVDVHYDTETNCDEYCDPYCRCGEIVNEQVEDVFCSAIVRETTKHIRKFHKNKPFLDYCIDRVFRYLLTKDNWYISIEPGYYGEEIGAVTCNDYDKINDLLWKLIKFNKNERIEYILTLEYGHLLEEVKNKDWELKTIKRDQITFNDIYHDKLNANVVESYKDYDLPIGIAVRKGDTFRLIDGYHRFKASEGKKKVKLIVS